MNVEVKMPFKSKAQQAYLSIHEPEVAKEFADHTSKKQYKKLPQYVAKDKNGLQALSKKHRSSK
jgi:hypothetical protein